MQIADYIEAVEFVSVLHDVMDIVTVATEEFCDRTSHLPWASETLSKLAGK